jgi:hypothetical protein
MERDRGLALDRTSTYEIKVPGRIDDSWSDWVEGLAVRTETTPDGQTTTTLTIVGDQAALQGLLNRLYSLGWPLLAVNRVAASQRDPGRPLVGVGEEKQGH